MIHTIFSKKSFWLGLALSGLAVSGVKAQDDPNPIVTGTPFLTISPDSRGSAMGDAGASTSADLNSQYWNPAKFPFIGDDFGFTFSYTPWLRELVNDIGLFYVGGHYRLDEIQTISASLKYFSLGEIQWTDETGTGLGTIQPNEFAIDAAYSRKLSDNFSAAVALRFIRSDMSGGAATDEDYKSAGNSYAADVAAFYTNELDKTTTPVTYNVGLNISNIGAKISYNDGETSYFLPTNFRLGTTWGFQMDDYNEIRVSGEMNKLLVPTPDPVNDPDGSIMQDKSVIGSMFSSWGDAPGGFSEELQEVMWTVGAEYIYDEKFAVRGGYFHENENKGNRKYFSVGAGFEMNVFALDVSYLIPMVPNSPLANTLRFSLSFGVDGIANLMGNK